MLTAECGWPQDDAGQQLTDDTRLPHALEHVAEDVAEAEDDHDLAQEEREAVGRVLRVLRVKGERVLARDPPARHDGRKRVSRVVFVCACCGRCSVGCTGNGRKRLWRAGNGRRRLRRAQSECSARGCLPRRRIVCAFPILPRQGWRWLVRAQMMQLLLLWPSLAASVWRGDAGRAVLVALRALVMAVDVAHHRHRRLLHRPTQRD